METTLCYISRGERTLMLYRNKKKDDPNAGKWLGVGGRMETGETPQACMLREVYEETGYRLTRWAYRGIVAFRSGDWNEDMHLFTADAPEGEPLDCDEGTLRWVPAREIESLPLWEGDRIFLRLLREGRPFFRLSLVYDERGERLLRAQLDGEALALGEDDGTRAGN